MNSPTKKLSRRTFMKHAGLVTTGLFFPIPHLFAKKTSEMLTLTLTPTPSHRAQENPIRTDALKRIRLDAIIDPVTGRLMGAINHQKLRHPIDPASLTKIVTYMVVQDHLKTGGHITLNTPLKNVTLRDGTFLRNDDLSIEDGLKYLMGWSINQIASALADTIAGGEEAFVEQMTAKVRQLGLTQTAFINPSGLPGRDKSHMVAHTQDLSNVSTLEDLSKLTIQVIRHYPEIEHYTGQTYTTRREIFPSTNPLYQEEYKERAQKYNVNGLKTGTTDNAGRALIATGKRDGHTLAVITYGHPSDSRIPDTQRPETALKLLGENHRLLKNDL